MDLIPNLAVETWLLLAVSLVLLYLMRIPKSGKSPLTKQT
ncbi:CYP3A5 isoform 14 [Pongo abelii]|uniref:CYP3A5 isoform 14 n=1 Tax=Pongo abelii TaxID=9601 RepID=A0A2J8RUF0_PONAB|nr:CYP3A5 isoform 4 [Pongo abelii]PNJ12150.1 CYP3A5 isoform 14 [Pongo abelii]